MLKMVNKGRGHHNPHLTELKEPDVNNTRMRASRKRIISKHL